MASNSTNSSSSKKLQGKRTAGVDLPSLERKISQEKEEIRSERVLSIQERMEANKKKVERDGANHMSLAMSRSTTANSPKPNKLLLRMQNPVQLLPALVPGSLDNDNNNIPETSIPITARLPIVEKIPPFTTSTFVTRNQKMEDDQSVAGTRRIYYDQIGSEAISINDSEEETEAPEEERPHVFSEAEKRIIRVVSKDYEPHEDVIQLLTSHIGGTTSEIKKAFITLRKQDDQEAVKGNDSIRGPEHEMNKLLEKTLEEATDTFNYLFCRQCWIFDCRLHGNGQKVITPVEWQEYQPDESEEVREPCGDQCYLISNIDTRTSNDVMREDSTVNADSDTIMNSKVKTDWKPFDKGLYSKGLMIFGRNSCNIARNICTTKTCIEVYMYMRHDDGSGTLPGTSSTKCSTSDGNKKSVRDDKELQISQSVQQKPRGRKHNYTSRSGGHKPRWRGIADGNLLKKQYTPCECNPNCGKDCPCQTNSLCCEKYCGCPKSCRNRYRGCFCAKGQCRNQQCPCFASDRECDPDVCRNCWVSCGGGSLGEPPRRGEGPCGNMRLLLRQKKRILKAKSHIAGWGAFLKDAAEKDEFIGEYTGELITQEEADRRENSTFLFNLNEEYVLDALRVGNKLKYANHSATPNCYAKMQEADNLPQKIITVGGDHRVAIFAKERIEAGQEIFYDYCYEPEFAPAWARKPDDPEAGPSAPTPQARGKKPQVNH